MPNGINSEQKVYLNHHKSPSSLRLTPLEPGDFLYCTTSINYRDAIVMANQTGGASSIGSRDIRGVLINGGQYVRYNVYGNLFEVFSKYVPPIRPIGRGAYGLVW